MNVLEKKLTCVFCLCRRIVVMVVVVEELCQCVNTGAISIISVAVAINISSVSS